MLSLRASLEEIARLGPGYVINEWGYEWQARELLLWLEGAFPHELERPVYLLRPAPYGDGAIYEENLRGERAYAVPLYRVEQRRVAGMRFAWSERRNEAADACG